MAWSPVSYVHFKLPPDIATPLINVHIPPKADMAGPASLRLELMQQDGVAFAVQTHRHSTDRTVDHIALKRDTLALEVRHEAIEVLDLERDRAACAVTRFFLSEVGEG